MGPDRPAEIPDDDTCASFCRGPGGTDVINLAQKFFLRLEGGKGQDVSQTGSVLLFYTE